MSRLGQFLVGPIKQQNLPLFKKKMEEPGPVPVLGALTFRQGTEWSAAALGSALCKRVTDN